MGSIKSVLRPYAIALALAGAVAPFAAAPAFAQASEIRYIVNNVPVTSYDIQRRAAFLRLQGTGNANSAAEEQMIEQAVRAAEIKRRNINISDDQVAAAYARFAQSNKLPVAQMDKVLNDSGVTKAHFREFIRAQMGWSQVMSQQAGAAGGALSEQDVVQKMLQQGGDKPKSTEYMLQQVIFVVPAAERGAKLGQRKREAEAMRQRFQGCETTREFAKGLLDVTVRDLGRVLEPELPPDWKQQIISTKAGGATVVRETDRGAEFIGICSSREVSDDRVAQMVFSAEQDGGGDRDAESKKLTAELRAKAQIIKR
ncbi:peptidylprolyl isomerase [Mesorhizobium sp. CAU 1732]|uniref:peptidylprolyl isomerase n=1 Tax=Mesorhizobium sp. CAU 1732 TaxID=3140358 RepID=UPI0032612CCD